MSDMEQRIRAAAAAGYNPGRAPRAPSLRQMADFINDRFPEWRARVESCQVSTDRKIPGTRLRHPGKGRYGNKLTVSETASYKIVFSHNAAETYRQNYEVCQWIVKQLDARKETQP
jgi:hypothetical protein